MNSELPAARRIGRRAVHRAARHCFAAVLLLVFSTLAPAVLAGESDLTVEVGIAHDDNPFETPSDPYFDQFDGVIVDPETSPGFFVPITVEGGYLVPNEKHQFVLDYRLRHHAYGEDNSNADETYLRVEPGYQLITRRDGRREDYFFAVPYVAYRKEIFFDRDTGVGEVIGLEDATNRYTYTASGGKAGFRSELNRRFEWDLSARYERRAYEEVPSLSSLDHDRLQFGSGMEIDFTGRLKLYLDYTYRILDYDERPSRDPDGGITSDRTPVEYAYHIAGATLRLKPADRWSYYFDLDYYGRTDQFAGYNDYDMLGGRVRAIWNNGRLRVRAAARYRQRDYARAFIFDKEVNPGTGRPNPGKSYDIYDVELLFEMQGPGNVRFFAESDWKRQDAADPRFNYHSLTVAAGVRWEFESKR